MRRFSQIGMIAAALLFGACSPAGGGELTSKVWAVSSVMSARSSAGPVLADPGKPWTIEFRDDGSYTARAECNVTGGTYETTTTGGLTLHPGPTSYEGCPSSPLVSPFGTVIARATDFAIADRVLSIKIEDGSVVTLQ